VIDTTIKGNIARFTNHSCNPNMYTKIVSVDSINHIIFFTRVDVAPGEAGPCTSFPFLLNRTVCSGDTGPSSAYSEGASGWAREKDAASV